MLNYTLFTRILEEELVPALGCTEPIAIAFGAALCKEYLADEPEKIEIQCSGNIIKNVMGVVVPNTNGMKGIDAAVAIGMVGGDAALGLEVLSTIDDSDIAKAASWGKKNSISVSVLDTKAKLHFIITMNAKDASASVEVIDTHTNVVRIIKDGKDIFSRSAETESDGTVVLDYSSLTVEDIIHYSETVGIEKIAPIISRQIQYNSAISEEGLKQNWGAMVGKQILKSQGNDLLARIKAVAAAGADARMSGCDMPVVINSGSGNQGITASLPVIEFAKNIGASTEKLIRALALSNLIAIHQKSKIGALSAYCGVVTAASGAGAAITWLSGGDVSQIKDACSNSLVTISGMICDGAKPSCAGKIAMAVESAFLGYSMAMDQSRYVPGDGIVKNTIEETIDGVGEIANFGMNETDKVILSVMLS